MLKENKIIVKFIGDHGLEPSAEEGRDYHRFLIYNSYDEIPKDIPLIIITDKAKLKKV